MAATAAGALTDLHRHRRPGPHLVLDMKNLDMWHMLGVAAAILLLTLAVLSVRFGHTRYPYGDGE